jgi:phospholipase C
MGAYDLTVQGPNGFYRRFAGDARRVEPLVKVAAAGARHLALSLMQPGRGDVSAIIEMAGDYPLSEGEARRRLRAGVSRPARTVWDLSGSDNWYDLTLRIPNDPVFVRRFAGHLETGAASRTDPAIGLMRL